MLLSSFQGEIAITYFQEAKVTISACERAKLLSTLSSFLLLQKHGSAPKFSTTLLKLLCDLTADNKCSSAYGKTSTTPCLSSEQGFCLSSSSVKDKTYDCDEIPYPLEQKKSRLCYCKQGRGEEHHGLQKIHCDRDAEIFSFT